MPASRATSLCTETLLLYVVTTQVHAKRLTETTYTNQTAKQLSSKRSSKLQTRAASRSRCANRRSSCYCALAKMSCAGGNVHIHEETMSIQNMTRSQPLPLQRRRRSNCRRRRSKLQVSRAYTCSVSQPASKLQFFASAPTACVEADVDLVSRQRRY
eukprot:COSAG01_NODE_2904_length_6887_cov_2.857543_7_plen_157_part_00